MTPSSFLYAISNKINNYLNIEHSKTSMNKLYFLDCEKCKRMLI